MESPAKGTPPKSRVEGKLSLDGVVHPLLQPALEVAAVLKVVAKLDGFSQGALVRAVLHREEHIGTLREKRRPELPKIEVLESFINLSERLWVLGQGEVGLATA
jgi:hypothetical protein